MKIAALLAFVVFLVDSIPTEESGEEKKFVEPEYLDSLLSEGRYEELSELLSINNPRLTMPRNESDKSDPASVDPSFIRGLFEGDILLPPELEESARQGMKFSRLPSYRWPGVVPYHISSNYSLRAKRTIEAGIKAWNAALQCIRFSPRMNERDYVYIIPGDGCYAYMGRQRGQQPLSLASNGCLVQGIILHEMAHTAGVAHEQSRPDRDNYVNILWQNIPTSWRRQYRKESANVFGIQGPYQCSSVMHYSNRAPGSNKPAFQWINNSCTDQSQVGQRRGQTDLDKQKIKTMYDCN